MKGRGFLSAKSFHISFRAAAAALLAIVFSMAALGSWRGGGRDASTACEKGKRAKSRGPLVLYHGALLRMRRPAKCSLKKTAIWRGLQRRWLK